MKEKDDIRIMVLFKGERLIMFEISNRLTWVNEDLGGEEGLAAPHPGEARLQATPSPPKMRWRMNDDDANDECRVATARTNDEMKTPRRHGNDETMKKKGV